MPRSIKLIGLDCGSTTTSLVVASARLTEGAVGRIEIRDLTPTFESPLVFTPFVDDQIDRPKLEAFVDGWLSESALDPAELFGGGALVTGLAARRGNAACITEIVEARLADAVIATANDPCLESWLAFMGNCQSLSRSRPAEPFVNIDVGGGTTNLAWGIDGQVTVTACLLVGARHFQFLSGTYEVSQLTPEASALADYLNIECRLGVTLAPAEIAAITNWYVELIEAAVTGDSQRLNSPITRLHTQIAPPRHEVASPATVTLSGGVGQLVYQRELQHRPQTTTEFGDLGGELAARIVESHVLAADLRTATPAGLGRATVYGLLRHATQSAGATVHLPQPERLPLKNVAIVGRLTPQSTDVEIQRTLDLAMRGVAGCVWVDLAEDDSQATVDLANRVSRELAALPHSGDRTLVVLVPANLGKVFGGYVSRWGSLAVDLIVLDEVSPRDAQFVRIGRPVDGAVGVSLYGMGG